MNMDLGNLYDSYLSCTGVSTDTRNITPGSLFVALKGPNFDANAFVEEALEKGAKFALIDDEQYADHPQCLLVQDGLKALQALATYHRQLLDIPVIGITGSNGKTTTKELVHAVLSKKFRTSATVGNLNNHIGVPLTVLAITPDIEIAIVEMGANHQGEIASLCEIARPSHGLITNIGQAHIEGFGGLEGVVRGKSELYQYLLEHSGTVFINSQDEILSPMAKRFEQPYFYPAAGDYLEATPVACDPFLEFASEQGAVIKTHLIGAYNFPNVAAALCIGKFFGVSAEDAQAAIGNYLPQNNRSQLLKKGSNLVILDAYNANPSSMEVALNNLLSMKSDHKAVIIGDMLELGKEAAQAHFKIGKLTREGLDKVIFCGPLMKNAFEGNPQAEYFVNKKELIAYLEAAPIHHTTVLVKASRSMGLEELIDYL